MSLDLDDRQRAMLQEMGVHVWWPQDDATAQAVSLSEPLAPPAATPPGAAHTLEDLALAAIGVAGSVSAARGRPDAGAPGVVAAPPEVADADWSGLGGAVAKCQACPMGVGRLAPVFAGLAQQAPADWLVVGDPPEEAEERAGTAFADQVGQLLDNMLKALALQRQDRGAGLARAQAAYVTNVLKCRPALPRAPDAQDLATCEGFLKREIALVQPKVILALGRLAAQTLLRESEPQAMQLPLGKLRGKIYHYQGTPVVVSYHPGYLLRTQQDKARAWADLCLALSVVQPTTGRVESADL